MLKNNKIATKDIAEVLVVIAFSVALIVCAIWLIPGNNGFSGSQVLRFLVSSIGSRGSNNSWRLGSFTFS